MRLVMTLMVRDEIDVLTVALDAHLALGVDHVVAIDNGSSDGSADVLRAYADRGVLTLLDGDASVFDQAEEVTRMARHAAAELGADWVINVDGDEVWWPVAGTLADVLAGVPDEFGVVLVPRSDFRPSDAGTGPYWDRMRVRDSAGHSVQGTRLVPKVAHRARADVCVAFGNHGATVPADDLRWAPPLPLIDVLHFPMRSYEQLVRKIEALAGRRAGSGVHPGIVRDAELLRERLAAGTLRAWYDELAAPDPAGLASGELVRDERLVALAATDFAPRAPDPAATAIVRDQFATYASWDRVRADAAAADAKAAVEAVREALTAVTAERARLLARIGELEALRDVLDANLAAERVQHRHAAEALRLLRESRALRAAAAARRALGR